MTTPPPFYTPPPGVPACLTRGQVARVLNMGEETVKGWLRSGALPSERFNEGASWRYVRADVLMNFAARYGFPLHWETVL
ncbi:helix-turn-helix domain-containing protein [Deinococcus fonticola]|uniref:helix-turn-helix domain-containing protein n=1 Tax=Deinococcus fonticola TaxID=2528713 RepID=UPI001075060F|nr:helix-turn-helix domain-containing protein [Deinococcus fonticola]